LTANSPRNTATTKPQAGKPERFDSQKRRTAQGANTTGMIKEKTLMLWMAAGVLALDQITKWFVLALLGYGEERVILRGFFKFVHWGNTGAAWSLFKDHNSFLTLVSFVALLVLIAKRRHFHAETNSGKVALGLLFGGIVGNLLDRIVRRQVIDFLYFYVIPRGGGEIGFPAFNVADSAICAGVGLLFVLSWQHDTSRQSEAARLPQR
jgi:signal peptidase II